MEKETQQPVNPNEALDMVLTDMGTLTVAEQERAELVATLRPIADAIPAAVAFAENCEVTTRAEAEEAARRRDQMVADAKKAEDTLMAFSGGLIARLFKTHRGWTGLLGMLKNPLAESAKTVKGKIIAYDEAVAKRAADRQRELQVQADMEAEAERKRLEKRSEKIKTPEIKEQLKEQAAAIQAPIIPSAAPRKFVAGRKLWKVKKVDKAQFLAAAVSNPMLQGFIVIDEVALARSKTSNTMFAADGVEFHQITV